LVSVGMTAARCSSRRSYCQLLGSAAQIHWRLAGCGVKHCREKFWYLLSSVVMEPRVFEFRKLHPTSGVVELAPLCKSCLSWLDCQIDVDVCRSIYSNWSRYSSFCDDFYAMPFDFDISSSFSGWLLCFMPGYVPIWIQIPCRCLFMYAIIGCT
jgi:hypothetical protein